MDRYRGSSRVALLLGKVWLSADSESVQIAWRQKMNEQKLSRTVIVTNPQGLHVRSADLFVKTASRYQTDIEVVKENLRVNGKSILDILMLAATEGTTLSIEAGGADAAEALDALVLLIEQNFGE